MNLKDSINSPKDLVGCGTCHENHFDFDVVDQVIEAFKTIPNRPMGCSIDFAVIEKAGGQQTVFLEMNDGYALGNYGLTPLKYAKHLSARWAQLLGTEDEFDFRKYR